MRSGSNSHPSREGGRSTRPARKRECPARTEADRGCARPGTAGQGRRRACCSRFRGGGAPRSGLLCVLFKVPSCRYVVLATLPRIRRFTPFGLRRNASMCHATRFTRNPCRCGRNNWDPLKVPACRCRVVFRWQCPSDRRGRCGNAVGTRSLGSKGTIPGPGFVADIRSAVRG